ncbi:MAG: hypothetical protein ACRDRH_27615 [Pseudonocardia sp.]
MIDLFADVSRCYVAYGGRGWQSAEGALVSAPPRVEDDDEFCFPQNLPRDYAQRFVAELRADKKLAMTFRVPRSNLVNGAGLKTNTLEFVRNLSKFESDRGFGIFKEKIAVLGVTPSPRGDSIHQGSVWSCAIVVHGLPS